MDDGIALGRALRSARTGLGLTQRDLAELAGVSERTVRALETATGNPSVGALMSVANAVGLHLELR